MKGWEPMADKILIVYYTHSGNTKKIAEAIQIKTGGILYEINPEIPYPVDYNTVVNQAKKEIKENFKPVLKTKINGIEAYDTVFVGSPNWWNTIAPPITTFLAENNLSGKTVIPFLTHGGGGAGNIERDIAKLCSASKMLPGLSVYESDISKITAWLQKIGIAMNQLKE